MENTNILQKLKKHTKNLILQGLLDQVVINVFKAGRIIKGTILEITKLKDNIDANCKFLFGL